MPIPAIDAHLAEILATLRSIISRRDVLMVDLLDEIASRAHPDSLLQKASPITQPLRAKLDDAAHGGNTHGIAFHLEELLQDASSVQAAFGFVDQALRSESVYFTAVGCRKSYWIQDVDRVVIRDLQNATVTITSLVGPASESVNPVTGPDAVGINLTAMARSWSAPPMGEFKTLPRYLRNVLIQLFAGYQIPVLVGEPGVGKSTLARQIAYMLAKGDARVHRGLHPMRVLSITRADLLAKTGDRGQLEERAQLLVRLADRSTRNIVFLDEIHSLFDGSKDAEVISNVVKPPMAEGRLRCFGATTRREFDQFLSLDPALTERIKYISVPEPSRDDVIAAFRRSPNAILSTEELDGWTISDEAIESAVDLSTQFMPLEHQPRKGANLLRATVADRRFESAATEHKEIRARDVRAALAELLQLDPAVFDTSKHVRIKHLTELLCRDIQGHTESLVQIAEMIVRHEACRQKGLLQDKPLVSFLFHGIPGTGKRSLARSIARHHFSQGAADRDAITDVSVAGFEGPAGVNSFRGAPPGYVGHGETRTIFADVRSSPRRVVLIRDVDRCRDLAEHIRSIIEDGVGYDGRGLATDFSGCIMVLTASTLTGDALDLLQAVDLSLEFQSVSPAGLAEIASRLMAGSGQNADLDSSSFIIGAQCPADVIRNWRRKMLKID